MRDLIKEVYYQGVEALIEKIKHTFTRRSATYRCTRCKRYEFDKMYWHCLECEFCCHLINMHLHERDDVGIRVGLIDREINNIFTRHFKEQIRNARNDIRSKPEKNIEREYL